MTDLEVFLCFTIRWGNDQASVDQGFRLHGRPARVQDEQRVFGHHDDPAGGRAVEDHEEPNDTCIHQWKTQGHGANHEQGIHRPKVLFPQSFLSFTYHIFQKAQVSSNKMIHKKRNHFLAQVIVRPRSLSPGLFIHLTVQFCVIWTETDAFKLPVVEYQFL